MPTVGRFRYVEALPPVEQFSRSSERSPRTLVLIHAFPLNAKMWEPQLALAEAGWRVIAPHLRGLDQPSPGPQPARATAGEATAGFEPEIASIDDYVGDVIDLLDLLHIESAVIGGLSLGGYVVLGMFRHAPRYFTGMILADTRAPGDTPEGVEGRKKTLAALKEKGKGPVLEELIPKLLGETTRRDRPDVAERLRAIVSSNSEKAIAGAVVALMTRPDSTPLLPTIHCPTLVIVGEEDTLTPPAMGRDLHAGISGSELIVLPGAGHLSSLERPREFNAAIGEFLAHRV